MHAFMDRWLDISPLGQTPPQSPHHLGLKRYKCNFHNNDKLVLTCCFSLLIEYVPRGVVCPGVRYPSTFMTLHIRARGGHVRGECYSPQRLGHNGSYHRSTYRTLRSQHWVIYLCWSKLSRRKLSPTLATAHYSCPDNAIGLVAQCELSEYVKLG